MGVRRQSTEWIQILPHDVRYTRELGLWLAVLRQAVMDYSSAKPGFYQLQSRRWFDSREFHPGSFLWVGSYFELDIELFKTILATNPKSLIKQIKTVRAGR